IAAGMLMMRIRPPVVSAPDLLSRSIAAEDADLARTDQVVHQTIEVEERMLDGGESDTERGPVLSRQRVELWQSGAKGLRVLRLYDERGYLIGGQWRKADGSDAVYGRHGNNLEPGGGRSSRNGLAAGGARAEPRRSSQEAMAENGTPGIAK